MLLHFLAPVQFVALLRKTLSGSVPYMPLCAGSRSCVPTPTKAKAVYASMGAMLSNVCSMTSKAVRPISEPFSSTTSAVGVGFKTLMRAPITNIYICKWAGITVHYCAEQFENYGSPVATIVKGVKRAMAGEYIARRLSL